MAAAARRRAARARSVAPRHPRRVSGPLRPASAGVHGGLVARGTTGLFERIRALPDHRVVDRLLRGRAWIWLVGVLLGGIVAMQVSMLKLNTGISRAVEAGSTLERQNASLETRIARLSSTERVRAAAAREGMISPAAGTVGFLTARPERDGRRAVAHMRPPSEEARAVMANGGRTPGALAATLPGAALTAAVADPTAAVADPTATDPTAVADPTATADPAAAGAPTAGTGAPTAAADTAVPQATATP